ncbi:F-box domain protein [Aspergillus mulundensis]|uniref:F-box domain-containing protein n=1 Tax=Aspergillus mulundensis TaxID=1810919 RepID=A0A3D8SJZ0_9EURO|nr:hypothetical protein DSM5745_03156 [Aspergillus mulundensis]RDW86514.1 hypothetical protein DSM5745_03156 [Aspergillus mulundensis]
MASAAPIELLPNELLDEIIYLLASPPASTNSLHLPPNTQIARSWRRDLKSLSLTCSRFSALVRPLLFAHGCFNLKDTDEYLAFLSKWDLTRYVTSLVVAESGGYYKLGYSGWWRTLLSSLVPRRLTVVASPLAIGNLFGMIPPQEHSWAFQIPHQVVQLELDENYQAPVLTDKHASILEHIPWTSMVFNEASSLKAYNHYEYFLYQVPSIFHRWNAWALKHTLSGGRQNHSSSPLQNLTSFTYIAVFPFYNHVQRVLDAVVSMKNLQTLKIQLGPCRLDRATEVEQRGSLDPGDPWMELATGYSLIAHAVQNMGRKGRLEKFIACDYQMKPVRAEIEVILGEILRDGPWMHDGRGTWTKKAVDENGECTTVVDGV